MYLTSSLVSLILFGNEFNFLIINYAGMSLANKDVLLRISPFFRFGLFNHAGEKSSTRFAPGYSNCTINMLHVVYACISCNCWLGTILCFGS